MKPLINTPIEEHDCQDISVFVKREDMAVQPPAPPFSKVRGLYTHLVDLKKKGVEVIGYVETSISMAGWGVAWACEALGMKAVLYDPQYKKTPGLLLFHRRQWTKFSPVIVPVPAGRARVNYYRAAKHLQKTYPGAVLLDLGLPLQETIEETSLEWRRTMEKLKTPPATTVVNVGSGTICAGILRGWKTGEGQIIGVLGRSSNRAMKAHSISSRARRTIGGMLGAPLRLEDPGWEYTEPSKHNSPFPCHRYYDLKAWEWLEKNVESLPRPILFWNIGRMR